MFFVQFVYYEKDPAFFRIVVDFDILQGLLFTNTMRPVFVLCKLVCLASILHQIRAACPTSQDLQGLRDRIDGTLILPGEQGYGDAGTMKAPNYNSGFNFVLYAKSIGKLLHLSVL